MTFTTIKHAFARNPVLRCFFYGLAALVIVGCVTIVGYSIPPSHFPAGTIVTITPGMTVSDAADLLQQKGLIRSPFLYKVYVKLINQGGGVRSGEYLLDSPESSLWIAYRMANDIEGVTQIKVTIPEGLASYDIARLFGKTVPGFDENQFLALAKAREGYLFPDTYYLYPDVTPSQVVNAMSTNFVGHISDLSLDLSLFGKSENDVITMASIVEKEATSSTDRRIIAGILWKRLSNNMALQVDPPFFYVLGKSSAALTSADLATNSPYNLYLHTGLPPTPIDNPGLEAIHDTVHPVATDYWFYMSDSHGVTHYSATLAEQDANIQKYLH